MPIFDPLKVRPANFLRSLGAATASLLILMWSGCGAYYRPVATPIIPTLPNPGFSNVALVLTQNGTSQPGASSTIDVAGDTETSQSIVGMMPVYALLAANSTKVFVVNSGDDTVSTFAPTIAPTTSSTTSTSSSGSSSSSSSGSSSSSSSGSGSSSTPAPPPPPPVLNQVTTISLPQGAAPDFVASTESATVYVANAGNGTVSAISATTNSVTNTVSVGGSPVAMAEMPNALKLYVVTANPSSVLSVNPVNLTANAPIAPSPGPSWINPVWVVARADNQRVYVLDEGAGSVSAIDTFSDAVVGTPASVGVGANFMAYDPNLDRIYVTNPTTSTVTALDASTDTLPATPLAVANPVSVATLPPYGSRFYVASARLAGTAPNQTVTATVTVFNAANLSAMTTIPLNSVQHVSGCPTQTWSELSMAAAADGSRVYVGNCDAGNTAVIQTSNNTVLLRMEAPTSAIPPAHIQITSASQKGSYTTYGYNPISGPTLRPGMSVTISGMFHSGNNGTFVIYELGPGTFTVINPAGGSVSYNIGTGIVLTPQTPVLVLAGSLPGG